MTAATQGYMSPSTYDPSNMFAPSGNDTAKNNDIFKPFGHGTNSNRAIETQQTNSHAPRAGNVESVNTDESSFFDFEPPATSGSPYRDQFSTPGASGMSWGNETDFRPLSPPDSASFSPKSSWAFPYQHRNPTNIFTNIDPSSTRAQYGQVTPPDDEDHSASLLDFQLQEQQRRQIAPPETVSPAKRRKRNSQSNTGGQVAQPTKRSRKYASRGSNAIDTSDKPEDVKRSKFLERNRVAASKCRQKKKEWTQNLENRARELQKNNNMLRMNVESLRQEVLFLKTEMLKHNSCDCEQIQTFMKSGAHNFLDAADDGVVLKREQSPIESMPGGPESPRQSIFGDMNSPSPPAERSNTSIVNDEHALEALLSSSINHDTSDEGIASQVAR